MIAPLSLPYRGRVDLPLQRTVSGTDSRDDPRGRLQEHCRGPAHLCRVRPGCVESAAKGQAVKTLNVPHNASGAGLATRRRKTTAL